MKCVFFKHFCLHGPKNLFCVDLRFPSTSVYFSGPAGGRSARSRPDMIRRALSLQSDAGATVILSSIGRHGVGSFSVANVDFLET